MRSNFFSNIARFLIYFIFLFPVAFANEEATLDLGEPTEQELDAMIDSISVTPSKRPIKVPAPKVAEPAPKQIIEVAKEPSRDISSFTQGFLRTKTNCQFKAQPNSEAATLLTVKKGKRLWLESDRNTAWLKGNSSKGAGYLSPVCF